MPETQTEAVLDTLPTLSRELRTSKNIFDSAVCLTLTLSKLGNSRRINTSSVEVGNADPAWIGVTKRLLESDVLKEVMTLDGEIRKYLYSRSVPSGLFKGLYIVDLRIVEQIDVQLQAYFAQRLEIVGRFAMEYPKLLADAQLKLGDKFDPSDYPDALAATREFGMEWSYVAFATPDNLACANTELLAREQEKMATKMGELTDSISQLLLTEMSDLVNNMTERLRPPATNADGKVRQPTIKSSLVGNFREFIDNFKFRNLSDNKELDLMLEKCKGLLDGVSPDDLRTNEALRANIQSGFASVKADLDNMITVAPARAIRVVD